MISQTTHQAKELARGKKSNNGDAHKTESNDITNMNAALTRLFLDTTASV